MRIHFFNTTADKLRIIYSFNEKIDEDITNTYLGFIVIRPIPEFYISRACLKKWYENDETHLFLSHDITASVLGITFTLNTIPFMEQDHETSICATSALWTFFLANNYNKNNYGLSPFSITNIALNTKQINNYNGLAHGFTVEMICNCIKENGLLPLSLDLNEVDVKKILGFIHTFIKSDYPVILGLSVYSNSNDIKHGKSIGDHAVTIVGIKVSESKLYIHDDRIGFYASLKNEKNYWKLEYTDLASKKQKKPEDEYYVVTDLITGVSPEIRLSISDIYVFCEQLKRDLSGYIVAKKTSAKKYIDALDFTPYIIDSSKLKKEVRENLNEYKSNAEYKLNVEDFLYISLPKFCWVAQFNYNNQECMKFIFDATDMIHGNCLQYVLFKSDTYVSVINALYEIYRKELQKGISLSNIFDKHLSSFFQFYSLQEKNKNSIYKKLDVLFGIAKSPRYIKDDEYIADEIKDQKPYCFTCYSDVKNFSFSDKQPYYLWIIDEEGYLYIGTENNNDTSSPCKGHPTLINGGKGRIGGELWCEKDEKGKISWFINSQSGRYSWVDTSSDELEKYLDNALAERFSIYFPNYKFAIKNKRTTK